MLSIREQTQAIERQVLSQNAAFSDACLGREIAEPACAFRTPFQRDRDRVIHCKAFRRLKHKTQVFLSPECDHYRTRLTHTLEVAQIARTIARALRLNEDLTEAIALAHDLGHTPFGHAGERALDQRCPLGFKHYEQGVRTVKQLERDGKGLNLTFEVLDGILNHTVEGQPKTLEGQVVRVSDRIAYINHDIDDAVMAGLLCEQDIPAQIRQTLGGSKSERINTLVLAVVRYMGRPDGAHCGAQAPAHPLDPETAQAFLALHRFMFESVYHNPVAKGEESKAEHIVQELYTYFEARPEQMPEEYWLVAEAEGVARGACDYIAGMTDRYALDMYRGLFIPKFWQV